MKIDRIRIKILQRDGTCSEPDKPCSSNVGMRVPFPRGQNVVVYAVLDSGEEIRMDNVKSVKLLAPGRCDPVTAVLEVYSPVVDVTVPVSEVIESDFDDGDFLGQIRTLEKP